MEITGRGDNASLLVLPKQLQSFLISHWRKVRVCCLVQFLTNPLPPPPRLLAGWEAGTCQMAGSMSEINGSRSQRREWGEEPGPRSSPPAAQVASRGNWTGVILFQFWPNRAPVSGAGSFHKAHAQDTCPPASGPDAASERQSLGARNTAVTHYPLTTTEVLRKRVLCLFSFRVMSLGLLNIGTEVTHNNNKNALLP